MNKIEVLTIQYNLQDAESIKYMLNAAGGERFSFSHSRFLNRGMAKMREQRFDVVLLDLSVPDRVSPDPVAGLTGEFPEVPVVVLTGEREEDRAVKALAGGAQEYLVKGLITPDLLLKAIRYSIERKRLAFENAGLLRDRELLAEKIRQMENRDSATGLPNRNLFMERLEQERDRADRQGKKIGVLILDLARQSLRGADEPRDAAAGDLLMKETASRLRSLIRKSDMIARTGENQFSFLLPDIVRPDRLADISGNLAAAVRKPFFQAGHEIRAVAAIGISVYPDDYRDLLVLLDRAHAALRRAAEAGGGTYQFWNQAATLRARKRMELEDVLKKSVASGGLAIYYQPLVDIATRRIVCAEALVRWSHPEQGLLSPDRFIPIAEDAGLITAIDEWVLGKVCRQAKSWLNAGLTPVCVTVNLSGRQLRDPGLANTIATVLRESGLPAGCLSVEVTEKTIQSDIDRAAARLTELAGLGVRMSIDDFGTGYSSVTQLERLPVERLKIDSSFIRKVPADPDNRTIVRSITSLAHNMRMKVVAEGVETEDQLRFLKSTGCDEMQGYLFSRPLQAREFEELLARR